MTNRDRLDIHTFRSASRPAHSPGRAYAIIRIQAPADEVTALFDQLAAIRGAHRVEVAWCHDEITDDGQYRDSDWRRVYFRGTERAARGAANLLMLSGLIEVDENADHDHARCIRQAAAQGVPAEWAHSVETYLSM